MPRQPSKPKPATAEKPPGTAALSPSGNSSSRTAASRKTAKKKVVVVGGGCAALTAAFDLTSGSNRDKFEVHVYTMGWRLGGKGASGRNADYGQRIEEHGLHVWMGFYENAFRIIRECYEELNSDGKPRRFKNWRQAFFPESTLGTVEELPDGSWSPWTGEFPPTVGLPGDPLDGTENPFAVASYFVRTLELTRALLFSVQPSLGDRHEAASGQRSSADIALDKASIEFENLSPARLIDKIMSLVRMGALATSAGLFQSLLILEVFIKRRQNLLRIGPKFVDVVEAIVINLRRQFEDLVSIDPNLRRKTVMIDVTLTIIYGVIKDGVLTNPDGLDCLNDFDCREWLRKHGASRQSVDSPLVKALYSIAFADNPDGTEGTLAAGQAIRGALRMFFTYRGALTWKMRGGMGDVIFSPLYQVLKGRGVKFHFFHRLTAVELGPSDDGSRVVGLQFDKQLGDNAKVEDYEPLINVPADLTDPKAPTGEYMCWPSKPLFAALGIESFDDYRALEDVDPGKFERTTKSSCTLKDEEHFDLVVLGVDVATIERTCKDILTRFPRWADMVRNVQTGATKAMQLWLTRDLNGPGWNGSAVTMSGLPATFDAFSQMNHLIPEERWDLNKGVNAKGVSPPWSVLYFCGVMDDKKCPQSKGQTAADVMVQKEAQAFLEEAFPKLLSGASARGTKASVKSPLEHLYSVKGITGGALAEQFFRCNHRGSDRYVLSRPGTLRYRISPLEVEIENMTIAGDWTDCGFNEGCVEAAVMSGRLASHALSKYPVLEDIIGFDHP